jgi:hypothetical protein
MTYNFSLGDKAVKTYKASFADKKTEPEEDDWSCLRLYSN